MPFLDDNFSISKCFIHVCIHACKLLYFWTFAQCFVVARDQVIK